LQHWHQFITVTSEYLDIFTAAEDTMSLSITIRDSCALLTEYSHIYASAALHNVLATSKCFRHALVLNHRDEPVVILGMRYILVMLGLVMTILWLLLGMPILTNK
jgi:hypothetical protein